MYKRFGKRLFDIIGALIILPIFLILLIPVGIGIWVSDRGNIFYNAKRLGKDGKVFTMYKFRSMKMNAPDLRNEDGSTYNGEDDPRLTKIGKFIRKTSIDELPQVINILKGNMSFIGPRPDLPEHMEMYEGDESRKLEVLPGITGYSQAYYRNSIEWKERIKNDIYYIDHVTPIMDIKIIFKTAESILFRKNVFINSDNGLDM
ncbi:MAG: sugar transferase [Candidatus Niameybacter stercoravium]|nr:sugar transferase [Candidatus Niameybacter stercoravium]